MRLEEFAERLLDLQQRVVAALETLDGQQFRRDTWERPEGGGGISCLLENGAVFERAGVSFSHVFGKKLPPSASAGRPELAGRGFEAMGVSLVLHPRNPYAPTVHMNVRFFCATNANDPAVWWFGGAVPAQRGPEVVDTLRGSLARGAGDLDGFLAGLPRFPQTSVIATSDASAAQTPSASLDNAPQPRSY